MKKETTNSSQTIVITSDKPVAHLLPASLLPPQPGMSIAIINQKPEDIGFKQAEFLKNEGSNL
ncbi:hypothetical protein [[Flexibacter] sp. ATCC 35208]|uniref:hypothetical protein n=1 Tax=[Flexibacter] sp. ATCC 35208 TaxID=1936242 RepID=UPI0009CCF21C|nr:hypothetical protein [[Flexibacter] sp. ATCC 35208]OMP80107.1 hypothetical protein BW716_06335 [[Flexibacter] sp. ATCC 35208]